MTRSEFLHRSAQFACGSCAAFILGIPDLTAAEATTASTPVDEALKRAQYENQFVNNWLTDLFDGIYAEVDPATRIRLLEACGRGCYRRHAFKRDIAAAGKGDVDKLVEAYRKNFGIRREGDLVHITYGGGKCYCPAARNRPARADDVHCECTRATHEAIWSAAMGRPYRAELRETVRRGGSRCHIVVHVS
ncbi:MAG TPA: hypothetical protein VHE61_01560 [Opitutaceae bacterium]|nr:hypothetical protein [Opitutaceae bacterium]